jgi:hypothetical protein
MLVINTHALYSKTLTLWIKLASEPPLDDVARKARLMGGEALELWE